MLISYQERIRLLVNDPTFSRYNDFDIQSFINSARLQVAGTGHCIRVFGELDVTAPTQQYLFSAMVVPTGVAGPVNVQSVFYRVPGSDPIQRVRVTPREWVFFETFVLTDQSLTATAPSIWAQLGQGVNGTFWINIPDIDYVLDLDAVCYPVDLIDDTTPEALPRYWSDAVPYYAAYLAYFTAQDNDRAKVMHDQYESRVQLARQYATPAVQPHIYQQGPDLSVANRLGIQPRKE